ncbi:SH3 domain-containing protein [Rhodobacterales bacterium HKCCSP123]|nr:SH3 domain-containing protein [Rhodobacterales bacterium HKCCSP123]
MTGPISTTTRRIPAPAAALASGAVATGGPGAEAPAHRPLRGSRRALRIVRGVVQSLVAVLWVSAAAAQSPDFMMNECSSAGQTYFRDFTARTAMQYNGQRVDGTHAINGRIYLETRFEDFACSYDRNGRRMVDFFAQGRSRPNPLPGGGGGGAGVPGAGDIATVIGLSAGDTLNVRSGPGTTFRIIGALRNGDRVRRLRCETPSRTTWCEIEMLTDMRERGWVSARYLTPGGAGQGQGQGGTATQLPSPPPVAGTGQTTTVVVRFPAGATGTELREQLAPNATRRYVLNARSGQFLTFGLMSGDPGMSWRILNPDSTLLDRQPAFRGYRGQLWQSGNHVIEVINSTNRSQSYTVTFRIN